MTGTALLGEDAVNGFIKWARDKAIALSFSDASSQFLFVDSVLGKSVALGVTSIRGPGNKSKPEGMSRLYSALGPSGDFA